MKGIDIFCASQASTSICMAMDLPSSSSITTTASAQLGGRAIDRYNPIIRDGRRINKSLPNPPCSSSLPPINPKPYHQLQKSRKSSSSSSSSEQKKKTSKSSLKASSVDIFHSISSKPSEIVRQSCVKPKGLITPPGSARHLLSDSAFLDNGLSECDPALAQPQPQPQPQPVVRDEPAAVFKPCSSSTPNPPNPNPSSSDQVREVVLRVSLHCKGCEGKLRKHLSRMEGVTSFNIDFKAKKVTVVGDVTPSSVLQSVSKVKAAQLWTTPSATNKQIMI